MIEGIKAANIQLDAASSQRSRLPTPWLSKRPAHSKPRDAMKAKAASAPPRQGMNHVNAGPLAGSPSGPDHLFAGRALRAVLLVLVTELPDDLPRPVLSERSEESIWVPPWPSWLTKTLTMQKNTLKRPSPRPTAEIARLKGARRIRTRPRRATSAPTGENNNSPR